MGFTWTIDEDGKFKLGFTEKGHGSLEIFHNVILDRGSADESIKERVRAGQDSIRMGLTGSLQAYAKGR